MPEKSRRGPRWGIVAAVSGLVGILLAIIVPLLPVPEGRASRRELIADVGRRLAEASAAGSASLR